MAGHLDIIRKGESETTEFKSSFNAGAIETLVAFVNTKGGYLYIGISDEGEIQGITLNQETIPQWVNEIKTKTTPLLIPEVETITLNDRTVLVFSIQEYPIKPVAFRGKYFKRIGSSNHILTTAEVVSMHLQSFNTSWDYHINPEFSLDDLSLEQVQKVIEQVNANNDRKISDDPLTFLLKYNLIREGSVSNAAFLLFTKKETVLTTIELGRFQTDIVIKDTSRTKADILTQVNVVRDFV